MAEEAKVAVTLPRELLATAKAAVDAGHAPSLSAYVTEALEEKAKHDALDGMLLEILEQSGGPLTDSERASIDRTLGWT